MASLSTYLSGSAPSRTSGTRGTGYTYPKPYVPYSVPRKGVNPIEGASSQSFAGQDLASALLQQRMVSSSAKPSTSFESTYDYDPILAKIQALASQSVNNATTNAAQLRKEALIASGQVPVGQELGFDASTLAAAGQNPESDYAQLQKEFAARQKQLEEAMSAQNLLYSGEYASSLSELGQGRASAEGSIGQKLRNLLSGVDTGLLGSQEAARQAALAGQTDLLTQANFAGHPIYDPKTGTYVYPTGQSTGGGGTSGTGGTTWFDMDGNARTDQIPEGWVIHGGAGTDISPYVYGPPNPPLGVTGQPIGTPPPVTPTAPTPGLTPITDPLTIYLGGMF